MKIIVQGLEFLGRQGITASEREIGHRFKVDIVAEGPDSMGMGDEIDSTVDYAKLAEQTFALCTSIHDATLEAAANRIGAGLLIAFPAIETLTLRMLKLHPALDLHIEAVGIEKDFKRVE